jgi:hypothetical protein
MRTTVKILPNEHQTPPGKLADAELHFTGGDVDGLKLIGFAVWEQRGGSVRHVTFPARHYTVNGKPCSFVLLRPVSDTSAQNRVRELVLNAYADHEQRSAIAAGRHPVGEDEHRNSAHLIPSS